MKRLDLTGKKFHFLTAIRYLGQKRWEFRCDCGTLTTQGTWKVLAKRNPVKSCGCMRGALIRASRETHSMSLHPAYGVWASMLARCLRPSHQAWPQYGGRGIGVCDRWRDSFAAFWADMGPAYDPGLTLDRLNNERGYYPGNCRWATRTAQARNTRASRTINTPRGRMLLVEASEISGIGVTTLAYRLGAKVPTARLFDPPNARNRFLTSSTAAPETASP